MKILAVDDDHMMLDVLRTTMAFAGLNDVTTADSAWAAAQMVADAKPPFDCIFIDFNMPEIKGDYLCSWIRHLPAYAATPIIMVTALTDRPAIEAAFASGASDYITKPIDPSDLLSRLKLLRSQISGGHGIAANEKQAEAASGRGLVLAKTNFATPFKIGEIKREIDLTALENYLVRISKKNIQGMSVFSFVIGDAAKMHLIFSQEEYVSVLAATGSAIANFYAAPHFFISYAGYGAFVGVIEGLVPTIAEKKTLERTVRKSLKSSILTSTGGSPARVRLFMAVSANLSTWSGTKIVDALYKTIGDAEEMAQLSKVAATAR